MISREAFCGNTGAATVAAAYPAYPARRMAHWPAARGDEHAAKRWPRERSACAVQVVRRVHVRARLHAASRRHPSGGAAGRGAAPPSGRVRSIA